MTSMEQQLNEVCSIATDGKLNSQQNLKISNLCRKIGSKMAVLYQALKQKAFQAVNIIDDLKEKRSLSEQISELKHTIKASDAMGNTSFADMVKKGSNHVIRPNNLSCVAINPSDGLKSSQ